MQGVERWLARQLRRLVCWAVGCRVERMQRGQGLMTCRDCGRTWRYWRRW